MAASIAPRTFSYWALDHENEEQVLRHGAELSLRYLRESATAPPFPPRAAIAKARAAAMRLPDSPSRPKDVLAELSEIYAPATVRSHSGRYFGFVHGSSFPVGLAAKWMSTIWDQNTPLFALSPATALLEEQVEEWLVDLLGLPKESAVGFVSSTSQSLLTAMFVARQSLLSRLGWCARTKGLRDAPRLQVVLGEHAHGAVRRALTIAGFGEDEFCVVRADEQGRLDPAHLPVLGPNTLLVLQAGNIYTGSFDPYDAILPEARAAGAWTHVDGAFGLWAAASPQRRGLTRGIEGADSWSADCHKTLNTPFSCGLFLCRDRAAVRSAMASSGSYLALGDERNGMDYSPDMARRCKAAEIWATLKFLGRDGVAALVERLCANAQRIADGLRNEGYEVLHDVVFNQISVRLENDDKTINALQYVQQEGIAWCGGGVWAGSKVIRISVSSWRTSEDDCTQTIAAFGRARKAV
jgi:glutamate/tyrosine decarboxylase-like PLP-dependent enzyme